MREGMLALAGVGAGIMGVFYGCRSTLRTRRVLREIAADTKFRKERKQTNEVINFELQSFISNHLTFRKFHHSWNNGTGYFNGAVNYSFNGINKGQAIYSFCPATSRILVIINKAGKDGKNIVWSKRYSEYDSTLWVSSYHGDGAFPVESNGSAENHAEHILKALKKYLEIDEETKA